MSDKNNSMSTSSNNNKKNDAKVDAKRRVAEMALSRRFLDVLTNHLEMVADAHENTSNSSSKSSKTFQLEPAERQILYEMNNVGLVQGLVAGVVTLTFLRTSRSYFQRTLLHRAAASQQRHQQSQQQMFTSSPSRSPFQQQQQQYPPSSSFGQGTTGGGAFPPPPPPGGGQPFGHGRNATASLGRIPTAIGWIIDCLAAFTTTVAVSVHYTDINQILKKAAELPLVEGKSVVARELCPPILQEIYKMQQLQVSNQSNTSRPSYNNKPLLSSRPAPAFDLSSSSSSNSDGNVDIDDMNANSDGSYSPRELLQHPQTQQLQAIVQFAENCKRRQVLERSLRREMGSLAGGSLGAMDIPHPGVPRDLQVDLFSSSVDDNEPGDGSDQPDEHDVPDFYDPNGGGSDGSGDDDNGAWSDDSEQRR